MISSTSLSGTSMVARSPESEFGANVLTSSSTKQMRLLFSRREDALRMPPVMLCRSSPEKEFTVPMLPPMLN
jgi:hypothetical protein